MAPSSSMVSPRWLVGSAALCSAASSCTPAPGPATAEARAEPPTWCQTVDEALGELSAAHGFRCLDVPNFLVTGFYGTAENPERSDFVNGCFAGEQNAARRLRMTVRPVGDLRFSHRLERRVSTSGSLDLGFLGAWAPEVSGAGAAGETLTITVELADAEIRVLSSVAEILGQSLRAEGAEPSAGGVDAALGACVESLCDDDAEPLVYTAKVLAAVPVIRLEGTRDRNGGGKLSIAGAAEFEVARRTETGHAFELRAKDKLNVAAVLEDAQAAMMRSGTCQTLRGRKARAKLTGGLREIGLRVLAGRSDGIETEIAQLRAVLRDMPLAFSEHERRDALRSLAVLSEVGRRDPEAPPTRRLCETRTLVEDLLGADGSDNRLHEVLTDVTQPLHGKLTELANAHGLPCADPPFYRDADGDGFGDPNRMIRAPEAPDGYVVNALDCFDGSADARPGQSRYFEQSRGDGSFDYDCDGRASPESEVVAGGCKTITRFGIPIQCWAESGWQEAPAPCGREGRWLSTCEEGMLSCDPGPTETRRQGCR